RFNSSNPSKQKRHPQTGAPNAASAASFNPESQQALAETLGAPSAVRHRNPNVELTKLSMPVKVQMRCYRVGHVVETPDLFDESNLSRGSSPDEVGCCCYDEKPPIGRSSRGFRNRRMGLRPRPPPSEVEGDQPYDRQKR
ncbi:hypothetical protein, partial [Mesorhizobium sp. M0998]|uniref:hypothetical protein n=1 Tax=Mesorhizobium sp. M0998 TaxID=2957044 RepID=UPI0033387F26